MNETKTITLKIQYDTDCGNPLEEDDGMWTLYEGRDVEQFFEERGGRYIPTSVAFFFKLRSGLAFMLGGSKDNYGYMGYYVEDFDPDAGRLNAVLVWEHKAEEMGAKTYEERKKDAKSTLDLYEKWYGGECFGWIINDDKPDEDSCWGFIGEEHVREAVIEDYLPDERPLRVILANDTTESIMGSALDKLDGVETLTLKQWREEERAFMVLADEEADELADSDYHEREVA